MLHPALARRNSECTAFGFAQNQEPVLDIAFEAALNLNILD
jgi:hypothetical protein